jgi:uncharacterized protein (DUF697 family)
MNNVLIKWHIGIDIGTTNSCVCFTAYNPGKKQFDDPVPIKFDGDQTLLSALLFDSTDNSLVQIGKSVYDHPDAVNFPERVYTEFKLDFGVDPMAEICVKHLATKLRDGLFRKIPDTLNSENTITNVGVPADWLNNYPERVTKLKQIVENSGFPNVETFAEPVGAMLYHSFLGQLPFENLPQNWLVVDIGGGTTDLAFVRTQPDNERPEVISTYGYNLGGKDFDRMVLERTFIQNHWVGETPTASQHLDLLKASQKFKEGFSSVIEKGEVEHSDVFRSIPGLVSPVRLRWEDFSAPEFAGQLMDKFSEIITTGIQNFVFGAGSINRIILTGGSSRWVFVREQLEFLRSRENVLRSDDPDLTVAKGLALARTAFIPPKFSKKEKTESWIHEGKVAKSNFVTHANNTASAQDVQNVLEKIHLDELLPDFSTPKDVCRSQAKEKTIFFAGGGALGSAAVAQIPGVASAGLPVVETKLLIDIAKVYGYSLDTHQAITVGSSMILSGMVVKMGVLELVGVIPGLGNLIKGGATAAFIFALGEAAVRFFEKRRFG